MPGPERREMPAGFADDAKVMKLKDLRAKYGAGASTLKRWCDACQREPQLERRTVPADFVAMAQTMTLRQLAAHYSANKRTIGKWLTQHGMSKAHKKWLPANIDELMKGRLITEVAAELGLNRNTLSDMLRRERPDLYDAARQRGIRSSAAYRRTTVGQIVLKPMRTTVAPAPIMSQADLAMRWLQRVGVCYPLRVYGRNLPGYRFMGRLWQADELVAEAKRRGWQPDTWPRLAA